MPNRILKDSICESEKLNQLSDFQFRLWVGLLIYVDDYGRGDARPAIIKGRVFPLRDRVSLKEIQDALSGLAGAGCVSLYDVDGRPYLYFPNWDKHQRIRQKVSRYPAPSAGSVHDVDSNSRRVAASCGELQQVAADCGELPPEYNTIQSESEYNPNPNPKGNARARFVPPTLAEVQAYCAQRGSAVDPQRFFEYFEEGGWKDSKGNPVKNWKQKLLTWEKYQPAAGGKAQELRDNYDMMRRWASEQD